MIDIINGITPTPTPFHHFIPTPTPFISPLPTPRLTSSAGIMSFEGDTFTIAIVLLICVIGILLVCVYAKLNKKL